MLQWYAACTGLRTEAGEEIAADMVVNCAGPAAACMRRDVR